MESITNNAIDKFSWKGLNMEKKTPSCCAVCGSTPKRYFDNNDQWHIYCDGANNPCIYNSVLSKSLSACEKKWNQLQLLMSIANI